MTTTGDVMMETELIFDNDLFNQEVVTGPGDVEVTTEDAGTVVSEIPIELSIPVTEETVQEILTDEALMAVDQMTGMTPAPVGNQPDIEISAEDELKSTERLDRSSPDLWPLNLSSAAHHVIAKSKSKSGSDQDSSGVWAQGLDPEDINLLHQFGSLTSASLVEEVKKLQNIAYQLGLEEAKEMTRGKLLHVLDDQQPIVVQVPKASHIQRLWK